jgi:hypothetical protein
VYVISIPEAVVPDRHGSWAPSARTVAIKEVRHFLEAVIGTGGFAVDDYSNHLWTFAEIAANTAIDEGRRFFRPE